MPAASAHAAVGASYAVIHATGSPRLFISYRSTIVFFFGTAITSSCSEFHRAYTALDVRWQALPYRGKPSPNEYVTVLGAGCGRTLLFSSCSFSHDPAEKLGCPFCVENAAHAGPEELFRGLLTCDFARLDPVNGILDEPRGHHAMAAHSIDLENLFRR